MVALHCLKKIGIGYWLTSIVYCFVYSSNAQTTVLIIPSASPSNSTLLSDYYSGRQTGLSVLLRNTDPNQPLVQGYLRITIEGQGVKLQTGSYAIFPSVDLMEGSTVNLGPSELAMYFKPQSLQGSIGFGVNQPNVFPEGFYQFCFEFLEKNTSRLVGTMQCVQANLSYSEPVDLRLPEDGQTILFSDLNKLRFQWKASHINVLNSDYSFLLVELDPNDKVSETSFAKAKPIYTLKLKEEKLLYGIEQPLLEKEKKYAWRVQTVAVNETGEKEPFKNDGFSEIYWFQVK
ncbi:MAG: Fibronectin type domain protein [Chitinophagaceae bacterium]|nr:Fibronectin type domain protein [Chitinophagaceae bacterium]